MSLEPDPASASSPLPPPALPDGPSSAQRVARQAAGVLRVGWGRAALAAESVLAIVYVLNLFLAWLQNEATPRAVELGGEAIQNPLMGPGIARIALYSMFTWHAVSFDIGIAVPRGGAVFGGALEASVTLAVMLGLGLTGYLLFRTGRLLADPGLGWLGALRGIQVALIYSSAMLVLAIVGRYELSLAELAPAGQGPDSVSIQPSLAGAFFMPFLLAAFAAGAGALSGRALPSQRVARLVIAAISGGWRAAWLAVALGSMGLLVVAALHPEVTRAYLDLLPGGTASKALTILGTLLILPNAGTGIAAAAMGGSINASALGDSCAVISFLQFPHGVGQLGADASCALPIDLGPAPLAYALFLLVPLAATMAGGWLVAQRLGLTRSEDGAAAGAGVALPFALWLWLLALLARVGYSAGGFPIEVRVWVGPGLLSTVLIALIWGAAGGAIGGAMAARNASGPGIAPGPPANLSG